MREKRYFRDPDGTGAALNALTFGSLIYTLDGFAHHERTRTLFLSGAVLLAAGSWYVRRQLRQRYPLLPVDLLRIPIFRLSVLTSVCSFLAQMSALIALPFFLQDTLGRSEVMTGLLLTPWPLSTLVAAPIAGYLVERVHPGILGGAGMAVFASGLFLLSALPPDASSGELIWRLMLCGAGFRKADVEVKRIPVAPSVSSGFVFHGGCTFPFRRLYFFFPPRERKSYQKESSPAEPQSLLRTSRGLSRANSP